ncbi:RNA pseudouridine synthase 5 isoform X3 [Beta vulgaris subsp. vulgaris]|uniref:RNA pseudouridine synthase 5 isoform X3 n=1 Tax=Beta vulgaris subsp. vulgaris TaxID=3555 RepID=UPI00203752C4|nr:RNA pseudouridine synthase 5 isoform X3 [Beta vulgaris subsp. vulgaris]
MKTIGIPWPELNDGLTYNDVVSPSHSGLTLIQFYSSNHTSSAPLQGADSKLVYHRLPWREPDTPFLLEVLFEDDDMIALNKPSGLQVLPGGLFQQRTVLTQLKWHTQKNGNSTLSQVLNPVPVHRLGRGTSGVLLCAKTKIAKTCLAAYFADGTSLVRGKRDVNSKMEVERRITKIYRALVRGIIDSNEVLIDKPIGVMRYPGVAKGLYVALPSGYYLLFSSTQHTVFINLGKPALSKVGVLERDVERDQTLVQVEIQSGRPHQIRIHLSLIGCPLLGDPLYVAGGQPECFDPELIQEDFAEDGGYQRPAKPVPGDCGYHLHAHEVTLSHPSTNEAIKIIAPLPSMLKTVEEAR